MHKHDVDFLQVVSNTVSKKSIALWLQRSRMLNNKRKKAIYCDVDRNLPTIANSTRSLTSTKHSYACMAKPLYIKPCNLTK